MKYLIAIASLLAAGTALANAETEKQTVSNPWATNVGIYHGFQINLSSITNSGTGSSTDTNYSIADGSYNIYSISLAQYSYQDFDKADYWDAGSNTSLVVLNSDNKILAISGTASMATGQWYANQQNKTLVSFSFDNFQISTADGTLKAFFVSSTDSLVVGTILSNTNIIAKGRFLGSTYDKISGVTVNKKYDGTFGTYTPCVQYVISEVVIPEPSAFGLLAGVGALALVAARRRRRAK